MHVWTHSPPLNITYKQNISNTIFKISFMCVTNSGQDWCKTTADHSSATVLHGGGIEISNPVLKCTKTHQFHDHLYFQNRPLISSLILNKSASSYEFIGVVIVNSNPCKNIRFCDHHAQTPYVVIWFFEIMITKPVISYVFRSS